MEAAVQPEFPQKDCATKLLGHKDALPPEHSSDMLASETKVTPAEASTTAGRGFSWGHSPAEAAMSSAVERPYRLISTGWDVHSKKRPLRGPLAELAPV
jgi:hypothetical protein